MNTLRDWKKKDALIPTGAHLQEPVDALRDLAKQVSLIIGTDVRQPQERFIAQIISKGPEGETDWTDERYWLQRVVVAGAKQNDNVVFKPDNAEQNAGSVVPSIITATNLSEWKGKTHGLPTNGSQVFEVLAWWDAGNPKRKHYFFSSPPANFWARLTAVDATAPYHYAWTEQYDVGGGVLADKPGGRSGTIATHFAVNALDDGVYGPLKLEVPDNVWMTVTFDTSGNPVYRFYAVPTLTVGTYCPTGPTYSDSGNIAKLSFHVDQFFVDRDTHPGESARELVRWAGFSIAHDTYGASRAWTCFNQVLHFADANTGVGGGGAPASPTNVPPDPTHDNDKFGVYWTGSGETIVDDGCQSCADPANKFSTKITAAVFVPNCYYRPTVLDCVNVATDCVGKFTFGNGFTVTPTAATPGVPAKVKVDLNLTVGTGSTYANFGAFSACGYQLNLCTETADVVTDVSCSGGTVTVTKTSKVFLKAC